MNKKDKIKNETPNAETIEAIKEVEAMKKDTSIGKTYESIDEMFDDLILEDLINSGFEGEELLNEFRRIKKSKPMALKKLKRDVLNEYKNGETVEFNEELFNWELKGSLFLKKKFKVYSNFFMCMNFFYYNGKYAAAIATMSAGSMLATLTLLSKSKFMPMHAISTEPTSER